MIHFRPRAAASAGLLAALVGCASPPPKPPPPTQLTGSIEMSAEVNPNSSRRPSPLLVRVYELKTTAAFNDADFMSLFQRDQAELGGDLVARDEYVLAPGETKDFIRKLSGDTHFVGVVAAYRDIDHATWRSAVAVDPGKNQRLVIKAEALAVGTTLTTAAK